MVRWLRVKSCIFYSGTQDNRRIAGVRLDKKEPFRNILSIKIVVMSIF
jgi:hypothetical protein